MEYMICVVLLGFFFSSIFHCVSFLTEISEERGDFFWESEDGGSKNGTVYESEIENASATD